MESLDTTDRHYQPIIGHALDRVTFDARKKDVLRDAKLYNGLMEEAWLMVR